MITVPLASLPWRFRDTTSSRWLPAQVPGCVHRDLQRAGRIADPFWGRNELDLQWIEERNWEYRAAFAVSLAVLAEEVVELVADGLDTIATVLLNGREVARTENMFIGYRWDVKPLLRAGRNELRIVFGSAMHYIRAQRVDHRPHEWNDPVGGVTRIRKQQCQFGWDWGPRFVTAGIWRDLRLEAWTGNRLAGVRATQTHHRNGAVTLSFAPELARPDETVTIDGTVSLNGRVVAKIENQESKIKNPSLWWPAGQGAQPLYDVDLIAHGTDGYEIGRWRRRLGLRTVVLDRHPDEWGESFQFVVNGRPVFLKGASWIPAHAFVAGLTRTDYERNLRAAVAANMNAVRVWGGGVYECDNFYDLCDELGLFVWHDFMFACTLSPTDDAFLASVRTEAEYQVRRIRHHPCLALWCGNNEIVQLNSEVLSDPARRQGYEKLFHHLLPDVIATHDPATSYWPSSEWSGTWELGHQLAERRGDKHFWDVWHARKPVKDYEKWRFRFVSEFGMQSFCSTETQATFCPPAEANIFGPVMENHQKNRGGNQVVLDYVSRRYRFPKSQDDLIYLSQLNQAYCMQTGVEHYRRLMPRCMGALYWQLNDCWPVASWSSIEFTGRWRALHYAARRFFAPALVSAHIAGEEIHGTGNYRNSTVDDVHLYTVYDGPQVARGVLTWELRRFDGARLFRGRQLVVLRPGTSVLRRSLKLAKWIAAHGRDRLYLHIALTVNGATASEESVLLAPPRFLELPKARTKVAIRTIDTTRVALTFTSSAFQHRFCFELPGLAHTASDNYFDLQPQQAKEVAVTFSRAVNAAQVRRTLRLRSLVDSY